MEKVTISIHEMGGSAFGETDYEKAMEVVRILRKLANTLENGNAPHALMDLNGNKVGTMVIE